MASLHFIHYTSECCAIMPCMNPDRYICCCLIGQFIPSAMDVEGPVLLIFSQLAWRASTPALDHLGQEACMTQGDHQPG